MTHFSVRLSPLFHNATPSSDSRKSSRGKKIEKSREIFVVEKSACTPWKCSKQCSEKNFLYVCAQPPSFQNSVLVASAAVPEIKAFKGENVNRLFLNLPEKFEGIFVVMKAARLPPMPMSKPPPLPDENVAELLPSTSVRTSSISPSPRARMAAVSASKTRPEVNSTPAAKPEIAPEMEARLRVNGTAEGALQMSHDDVDETLFFLHILP